MRNEIEIHSFDKRMTFDVRHKHVREGKPDGQQIIRVNNLI